jgi:hypothetical protein
VLLTVSVSQTWALQPCSTRPDEYRELLHSELRRQVPETAIVTFLVIPSFRPEYGLVITQGSADAQVTVVQFVESVWAGSWEKRTTPGPISQDFSRSRVKTKNYRLPISNDLTVLLKEILASKTSYTDEPVYGLDGVTYIFSTANGKCGETWSPTKTTRDRLLVETFEKLMKLAEDPGSAYQRAAEPQLLNDLKAQWAPVTPNKSLERTRER